MNKMPMYRWPGIYSFLLSLPLTAFTVSLSAQSNNISNFRTAEISSLKLQVTVDYTYDGNREPTEVLVVMYPVDSTGNTGRFFPDVDVPAQRGNHTATLVVRMTESGEDWTSTAIAVCFFDGDSSFFCKKFPYKKKWSANPAATITQSDEARVGVDTGIARPSQPLRDRICEKRGTITGQMEFAVATEPGGPARRIKLTRMVLEETGTVRSSRITIRNGVFSFKIRPGRQYKMYPEGYFRSEPRSAIVSCENNETITFRITGPPIQD